MTHHDKARELVERLKQWDFCWPAPGLEHDVTAAADLITALAERIEALEAALKEAADELDEYYWAEYPMFHPIHRRKLKYLMENNPARRALDATCNT